MEFPSTAFGGGEERISTKAPTAAETIRVTKHISVFFQVWGKV